MGKTHTNLWSLRRFPYEIKFQIPEIDTDSGLSFFADCSGFFFSHPHALSPYESFVVGCTENKNIRCEFIKPDQNK